MSGLVDTWYRNPFHLDTTFLALIFSSC